MRKSTNGNIISIINFDLCRYLNFSGVTTYIGYKKLNSTTMIYTLLNDRKMLNTMSVFKFDKIANEIDRKSK